MKVAPNPARIKVVGLGGGGCNAISRMVNDGIPGVDFIAANSDAQALELVDAPTKIRLGEEFTGGLGVGGDPEQGQKAMEESKEEMAKLIEGADMVFITAGLGGGTGTGAAPIVAEQAKEAGALTIGVVTKPFGFEGAQRMVVAKKGISQLLNKVDTLIVIPNDQLFTISTHRTLMQEAFKMADQVLQYGVQGIAELITIPGMINLDFADVKSIMKEAGPAWMSIGWGSGERRTVESANKALSSSLLEVSIDGAKGILFNVTAGRDLTLHEVREAAAIVSRKADPEANIIFGVVFNPEMGKEVRLTLIATGFASEKTISPEEEREQLGLDRESELDIPSFLRRSLRSRQEKGTTFSTETHSLREQFPGL